MKKLLVIGIIFLFIGVAVAPSINFTVVKASNDNDLVEVTSQACGIKGFGNTTVKLTKQQYQNLEQYLVDFRARLNQTTTREEALPIFKEAVVELNKYGLLPKEINIEQAQRLMTPLDAFPKLRTLLERTAQTHPGFVNGSENHNCLIAGKTSGTRFEGPAPIFFYVLYHIPNNFGIILPIYMIFSLMGFLLFTVFSAINPFPVLSRVNFGGLRWEATGYPAVPFYASGWVYTQGTNGVKTWQGDMQGDLPIEGTGFFIFPYPGAVGFTGIKVSPLGGTAFYLGSALWVSISNN